MKFIFQYKHTKAKISLKTNIKRKICSSMCFSSGIVFYIDSLNQLITTKTQSLVLSSMFYESFSLYFFSYTSICFKKLHIVQIKPCLQK